jgi:hypothetical protein
VRIGDLVSDLDLEASDEWSAPVLRYKGLEDAERFVRTLNSELDVRPIRHCLAKRGARHMSLRILSYYISWHMKQRALLPARFTFGPCLES